VAKILIADDSDIVREQVKSGLAAFGHEIVEATDGQAALELMIQQRDIEIAIVDVNMPRMDGLAFVKAMLATDGLQQVTIIMQTTETSQTLRLTAKEMGIRYWAIKPVDAKLLHATIAHIMKKSGK